MAPVEFASIKQYEICQFKLKGDDTLYNGLFTSLRVDSRSVPVTYHKYDIRGTDDDGGGSPVSINHTVIVNHFGTIITKEMFPIPDEHDEPEITFFNFTSDYFEPGPVVYAIAYVDYSGMYVRQIFSKWDDALIAYKAYEAREDMFDLAEEDGFRIVTYYLQTSPIPDLHKPNYLHYSASPDHGIMLFNDVLMDDEYLSKPNKPILRLYTGGHNEHDDAITWCGVELEFSIDTKGVDDYYDAKQRAEFVLGKYIEQLKTRGIDYSALEKITHTKPLEKLGFKIIDKDRFIYGLELDEVDHGLCH